MKNSTKKVIVNVVVTTIATLLSVYLTDNLFKDDVEQIKK